MELLKNYYYTFPAPGRLYIGVSIILQGEGGLMLGLPGFYCCYTEQQEWRLHTVGIKNSVLARVLCTL